jgi:hypothetical protein
MLSWLCFEGEDENEDSIRFVGCEERRWRTVLWLGGEREHACRLLDEETIHDAN